MILFVEVDEPVDGPGGGGDALREETVSAHRRGDGGARGR